MRQLGDIGFNVLFSDEVLGKIIENGLVKIINGNTYTVSVLVSQTILIYVSGRFFYRCVLHLT